MENGSTVVVNGLNGSGGGGQLVIDTPMDEEMNGMDLSTKGSISGAENTTPSTPTNGIPEKGVLEMGQLSPSSLRRSTRASALKAQQKIKDGDVPQPMEADNGSASEDESQDGGEKKDEDGESAAKKRKLESGKALDQFSHEFAIKMEDDGEVYMLDDGSEISSLNESEVETLKKCYDKLMARELNEEQKTERLRMIKQAEADLRSEEAKLTMIKKMRTSQIQKTTHAADLTRKLTASVAQNSTGAAYKPPVANSTNKNNLNAAAIAAAGMLNGKGLTAAQLQALQSNSLLAQLTPQQKEMLQRMNLLAAAMQQNRGQMTSQQTAALAAAFMQAQQQAAQVQAQAQQQQQAAAAKQAAAAQTASSAAQSSHHSSTPTPSSIPSTPSMHTSASTSNITSSSTPAGIAPGVPSASTAAAAAQSTLPSVQQYSSQTPAQRLSTARLAFRKTADTQLMSNQLAGTKSSGSDVFFIPNGAQPDFCYLLGLDLCVQRVLRDKTATKPVTESPYECESCGTDFTPTWRAIRDETNLTADTKPDDLPLHLYCENCVRAAQKKKIRDDKQSVLKKMYVKVTSQEKEFEKQILEGKLEQVIAAAAAMSARDNRPTASSSPAVQNLSTKPSTPSVVPTPPMATPSMPKVQSTPTLSSTPSSSKQTPSSSSHHSSNNHHQTPSSSSSSSNKRPSTNSTSSQMQQQLAALASVARANPMMAAMMGLSAGAGGLLGNNQAAAAAAMQWNPLLQMQQLQQLQQARMGGASSSSGQTSSSNTNAQNMAQANMAMNLLAQAVQQGARSSAGSSSSTNANANAMAQLAAAASLNPAALFAANPNMLRQMQQMAAAAQQKASKK